MAERKLPNIRARVVLRGGQEVDAYAVNPGEWFGKKYVLQIAIANALNPFLVIEADTEQDAIDTWADSDSYGHLINVDDHEDVDEDTATAGNDSHPVDLSNVGFSEYLSVEYYLELPDQKDTEAIAELAEWVADYAKRKKAEDTE